MSHELLDIDARNHYCEKLGITWHMLLNVAATVIALIVTFLSAVKTAKSEFLVLATEIPTTRGLVSGPLTYRVAIALSNSKVLSKSWKSLGTVPGATILLKSPA